MQKLKNEKGITLATLVITVIILLMISTPIVVNFTNIGTTKKYTSFKDDIDTLRESIDIAYRNGSDISSIGPEYDGSLSMLEKMQDSIKVKNANDNDKYYIIDLKQLNEKSKVKISQLNYGERNKDSTNTSDDVYIINERSKTIYYVKGLEYKGVVYHRLPEQFSSQKEGVIPGQEVKDINVVYTDKDGSKATIPVGYMVSNIAEEQIISKGLVIKDKQGNEFVWIPTKSFNDENKAEITMTFDRQSFDGQSKGGEDETTGSHKIYNEGDYTHYFYEKLNEQERKSVLEHGGFYIGRYEATSDSPRNNTSPLAAVSIQKNKSIYNFVSKEDAITLSNNFAKNEYVTSRLCSGYCWDTTLKFIEGSGNNDYISNTTIGNHSNAINVAGISTDKINNIYDLSGNVYEWSLENTSKESLSVIRGGAISTSNVATTRKETSDNANINIGFRITLFVK